MGNCCCKSGAGAVAASQSDVDGGVGTGTGRHQSGASSTTGRGKQGGAVRLDLHAQRYSGPLPLSRNQFLGLQGGAGSSDPNYGAIESTSSVKVAVVVGLNTPSMLWCS